MWCSIILWLHQSRRSRICPSRAKPKSALNCSTSSIPRTVATRYHSGNEFAWEYVAMEEVSRRVALWVYDDKATVKELSKLSSMK
jgi:hypothetical protein